MSLANYDEWLRLSEVDETDILSEVLGGLLSSEDLKWGDLEFLDLASGPQVTAEIKNRNKNPTLGYPYADLFLEKCQAPSSVSSEAPFKVTEPPSLDLEKTILADLFSSSDAINDEGNEESNAKNDTKNESSGDNLKECPNGTRATPQPLLDSFNNSEKSRYSSGNLGEPNNDFRLSTTGEDCCPTTTTTDLSLNAKSHGLANSIRECAQQSLEPNSKAFATVSLRRNDVNGTTCIQVENGQNCHRLDLMVGDCNTKDLVRHLRPFTEASQFKVVKDALGIEESGGMRRRHSDRMRQEPYKNTTSEDVNWIQRLVDRAEVVTERGKRMFVCHVCATDNFRRGSSFDRRSKLRLHLMTHRQVRPYKCDNCDRGFFSKFNLMRHRFNKHVLQKEVLKKYRCETCGTNCSTPHNLANHLKLKHNHQQSKKDTNNNHDEKRGPQKRPIICPLKDCGRGFSSRGHLETHLKFSHVLNSNTRIPKLHNCSLCQSSFKSASKLRRHERIHDKSKARLRYKCEECDHGFLRREHLTKHKLKVHKTEEFRCPIVNCDRHCPSLNLICKHFKNVHQGQDTTGFHCVIMQCEESIFDVTSLRLHLEAKHQSVFGYNGSEDSNSTRNPLDFRRFLLKAEKMQAPNSQQSLKPLIVYEETFAHTSHNCDEGR